MGITAINKTAPRKLITSFLSVKNENECFSSSKYQIAKATIKEIESSIIGKMRQQYLFFSIIGKDDFYSKIKSFDKSSSRSLNSGFAGGIWYQVSRIKQQVSSITPL